MNNKQFISDASLLTTSSNSLIGKQVLNISLAESTMDEVKELAKLGAREGLVVIADNQSRGRGRFNREWLTTSGQDLAISILFKPALNQVHMLNMVASLAIQETISELTQEEAEIKWPNDVLVNGKKVSGVLIETVMSTAQHVDFAVVGIGLNVNLNPVLMDAIKDSATSISLITGSLTDKYVVLSKLLSTIDRQYQLVLQGRDLRIDWATKVSTIGNKVKVLNGSNIISGYAVDLDSVGNLILETKQGRVTVASGDVTLI